MVFSLSLLRSLFWKNSVYEPTLPNRRGHEIGINNVVFTTQKESSGCEFFELLSDYEIEPERVNADWRQDTHTKLLLRHRNSYIVTYTDFKLRLPRTMKDTFTKVLKNWETSAYLEMTVHMRRTFKHWKIHKDTERMLNTPNAGGSSAISEAVSFELLHRLFDAELIATEMEIVYNFENTKKTDLICDINGVSLAISVTRAMKQKGREFTKESAIRLLEKKLNCVLGSNLAVSDKHAWFKQMLLIWVQDSDIAKIMRETYEKDIDSKYKTNTIVVIVLAERCYFLF